MDIINTRNIARGAAVAVGYVVGGPVVACAGLAASLALTRDGGWIGAARRPAMVGCRSAYARDEDDVDTGRDPRRRRDRYGRLLPGQPLTIDLVNTQGDASYMARLAHG